MARNPNDQLSKARSLLQGSNLSGALDLVETVLRKAPVNPDANYLLGVIHLMMGRANDAIAPLELTLRADPGNGAALDSLGLCYLMQSRFPEAEGVLRKAAAIPRAPAEVYMRLGVALLQQERSADAIPVLQRAVSLAPENADCQINLGRALHADGQVDAACKTFEAARRLAPSNADVPFNLGVICLEQDKLGAAADWFNQAIAQAPRHTDAWVNLGITQERQQQLEAALTSYRKAMSIDPSLPAAGNNLAHVLTLLKRHSEAREQYLAVLQNAPQYALALEGLASVCLALGRINEAITHLKSTVQAEPENHLALSALAAALLETGKLDEVEPLARRACALNPRGANAYVTLANLQGMRGELEASIGTLEEGYLRTDGADNGHLLGMLTFNYRQVCDWEKWSLLWTALLPRVEHESALGSPFWLLCEPITAQQHLTYTKAWAEKRFSGINPIMPNAVRNRPARLRIGYLSSDFHEHATAYLIADILELHDRSQFEIFAYSYGPEDHSATCQRLRAACEHFVDIAWDTDDAAAARIRADEIDILVDLKGYTLGDRVSILARRPCNIQVTWLGFPGTTGTPCIDYVIADPIIVRPEDEAFYSEQVLRMPFCYQPNDRKRMVAEPLSRTAYGLPDDAFVFCCFNQAYKITPDIFLVWLRLLRDVPHSRLWLLDSGAAMQRNLLAAAEQRGVHAEQLVFAPRRPNREHLARYGVADLALDTFPYTSHTTLSDALWCGCPMVGLTGDTFAARVSCSLLAAAGVSELATASLTEYAALAIKLATNAVLLKQLRAKVALSRNNSPLFDSERFARDLERLYERVILENRNKHLQHPIAS